MKNRILYLTAIMLLNFTIVFSCKTDVPQPEQEADPNLAYTSNGPVRGLTDIDGIHVFKGVRYGAPPVGKLRFKPPVRPASWDEPVDAREYGNRAMQGAGFPGSPTDLPEVNEDCLFLNIWTPDHDDKKRPVMVWLHGGGFSSGSGGDTFCEGKNLAQKGDVVVVTINHRLNVFGFLQLGEKWGPEYASSGQAGMLDIVLSLEWVRDNISSFGGDPGNVTIFGESGGGRKTAMLMAMEPAAGLFHKAIIQSGSGLDAPSKEEAVVLGRELLKNLDITEGDVDALASVDAQKIFDAQPPPSLSAVSPPGQLTVPARGFVPCVDGIVLKRKPFIPDAPAVSANIPLMIGSNKDEMTIFRQNDPGYGEYTDEDLLEYVNKVLPEKAEAMIPQLRAAFPAYSPTDLMVAAESLKGYWIATVMQAERKVGQNAAPVYVYLLAWETLADNGRLRAHHALDVPLVFNNIENQRSMVGEGDEPQKIADIMSSAWVAFARTGNPGIEELPEWPEYDLETRETMVFDIESYVENDPYRMIRKILINEQ
ncbi:carboxylesterase/lipase family protein [Thermodesulfobacteriota bacterium]